MLKCQALHFHSDDNLDSHVSQSPLPQRIDSLEDILDRHEAIFGTGQSPAEAPSLTLHPTEPSETSWECIESFPSPRDLAAYDLRDEPLPSRKPQHKEALLRMHSRAKYLASLPKRGGLPPPKFCAQVTASDVGGGHADRPTASSS